MGVCTEAEVVEGFETVEDGDADDTTLEGDAVRVREAEDTLCVDDERELITLILLVVV